MQLYLFHFVSPFHFISFVFASICSPSLLLVLFSSICIFFYAFNRLAIANKRIYLKRKSLKQIASCWSSNQHRKTNTNIENDLRIGNVFQKYPFKTECKFVEIPNTNLSLFQVTFFIRSISLENVHTFCKEKKKCSVFFFLKYSLSLSLESFLACAIMKITFFVHDKIEREKKTDS